MPKNQPPSQTTPSTPILALLMCVVAGAVPVGIALGLIAVEPAKIHAPRWLLGMAGGLLWLAGVAMLLNNNQRINNLLGALMLLLFGVIGGWVALKGESSQFGGGIALLSHAANEGLARWLFGGGALICFTLALYALKQALKRVDK